MNGPGTTQPQPSERELRIAHARRARRIRAGIWLAIGIVLLAAGIWWLLTISRRSETGGPGVTYPDQGAPHVSLGTPFEYNSNPPTSGPHYAEPAKWGIYDLELPDEQLVHNLEHGGIWISYRDAGDQDLIAKLKDIADDYALKVIMTPRPQNDSAMVLAAWTRLLQLETFDEQQIKSFIKAFITKGPEQVPF